MDEFKHPFHQQLRGDNRRVQLAELVPWDELADIYARNLNPRAGRLSVDIRMVIGALIFKHRLTLSDRGTVAMISENMDMYQNKVHSCSDRIVNIYQPHVGPMLRGKDRANVEFGSKINISEVEGFVRCDHLGWDNYDEGADLNRIRARRQDPSESWISAIFFVMNLTKLMKIALKHGYSLALS